MLASMLFNGVTGVNISQLMSWYDLGFMRTLVAFWGKLRLSITIPTYRT